MVVCVCVRRRSGLSGATAKYGPAKKALTIHEAFVFLPPPVALRFMPIPPKLRYTGGAEQSARNCDTQAVLSSQHEKGTVDKTNKTALTYRRRRRHRRRRRFLLPYVSGAKAPENTRGDEMQAA